MSLSLPSFPARPGRDQAALDASRAIVGLYLRERSSDFSVRELAAHAKISERSFYRYFPRKEDAIRPYVEAALGQLLAEVRAALHRQSLFDAVLSANAALLDTALANGGSAFLTVVQESEPLRAVWLEILTGAEAAWAELVAEHCGLDPASVHARFAAAAIVAAGRVALEVGAPPSRALAACFALLSPELLVRRCP